MAFLRKSIFIIAVLIPSFLFADEVLLKSGQKVEGKIIEQNDKYIKIDTGLGTAITYYMDEIDSGKALKSQSAPISNLTPDIVLPPAEVSTQVSPESNLPDVKGNVPAVNQAELTVANADNISSLTPPVLNPSQENSSQEVVKDSVTADAPSVKGRVQGLPFALENATFSIYMNTLELRQGKDFFADLEVLIFLFSPEGTSWENAQLHITPESTGNLPHVWKKWKVEGKGIPESKTYMSGYNLDLTFGAIKDGKIHGTIKLRIPDEEGSYVEGSFDAVVTNNTPQKSPKTVFMAGNGLTKALSGKSILWASLGGFGIALMVIACIALLIFPALCLQYIAKKTNRGEAWMAWMPIANLFLMCKIGDIRYTWLWLLLLAVIPILGWIAVMGLFAFIWYKIALALNKPGWWGILAIVPGVNMIAQGYLAFSE